MPSPVVEERLPRFGALTTEKFSNAVLFMSSERRKDIIVRNDAVFLIP